MFGKYDAGLGSQHFLDPSARTRPAARDERKVAIITDIKIWIR